MSRVGHLMGWGVSFFFSFHDSRFWNCENSVHTHTVPISVPPSLQRAEAVFCKTATLWENSSYFGVCEILIQNIEKRRNDLHI